MAAHQMLFGVQYFLWMLAVYASPPPSPAVDARLATGLRAADFPDRTFTGKSTSALHGALPWHRRPVSQVPYESQGWSLASSTPDTVRTVSRCPSHLSRE